MRSLATDPVRNFKFLVTIMSSSTALPYSIGQLGFMTVDGLGIQNEVIPYREGGDNTTTRKLPGQTDFGPITMSRGMLSTSIGSSGDASGNVSGSSEIYKWLTSVFSAVEGQGSGGPTDNFRADITVDVLEHPDTSGPGAAGNTTATNWVPPIKGRFYIYNAWPMGLNWSGLDAGGNAIMIETLQLAHEGFQTIYAPSNNTPGSYVSATATSQATA